MIVGYPGHFFVPLAKLITRKKIIFDAFISLYNTRIFDRNYYSYFGIRGIMAYYLWIIDWLSCKLADKIILDTNEHINYFLKKFGINRNKFIRIFVGSDDDIIFPIENNEKNNEFVVHFHGHFIPLQGIEYIIKAAKLLENDQIMFNIIGRGQTYKKSLALASELLVKNINFIAPVSYEDIGKYMSTADICLGIFGKTDKAQLVIPNKVYEALAAKRAVITGKSDAINEVLTNKENVLLCEMGNEIDLAEKIIMLKNNREMKDRLAKNGYVFFKKNLTPKLVTKDLIKIINSQC